MGFRAWLPAAQLPRLARSRANTRLAISSIAVPMVAAIVRASTRAFRREQWSVVRRPMSVRASSGDSMTAGANSQTPGGASPRLAIGRTSSCAAGVRPAAVQPRNHPCALPSPVRTVRFATRMANPRVVHGQQRSSGRAGTSRMGTSTVTMTHRTRSPLQFQVVGTERMGATFAFVTGSGPASRESAAARRKDATSATRPCGASSFGVETMRSARAQVPSASAT